MVELCRLCHVLPSLIDPTPVELSVESEWLASELVESKTNPSSVNVHDFELMKLIGKGACVVESNSCGNKRVQIPDQFMP